MTTTSPEHVQGALQLGAFIAAENRDAELAETVATITLERLVSTLATDRLLFTAIILVECAAATENRNEALATLARWSESVAFVAPTEALPKRSISFESCNRSARNSARFWRAPLPPLDWAPHASLPRSYPLLLAPVSTSIPC